MRVLDWLFGTGRTPSAVPHVTVTFAPLPRSGGPPTQFPCQLYDPGEQVPVNTWFQRRSWNNTAWVKYQSEWPGSWVQTPESPVKVAGTSFESRARDFLLLAPTADFRLALEAEPDNPVSPLARKVVASGTLDGQHVTRQIGYLPDSLATRYADAELDVRPHRVFVPPTADLSLGIEIAVLIRKARPRKRAKATAPPHTEGTPLCRP